MIAEFFKKKYREKFLSAFIRQGVSMQIQALRRREGWSQKKLGEITGKKQNAIARLEDPSYGKFTVTTLIELANAFDVALLVKFVPFSEIERQSNNLSHRALCVARFSDETNIPPPKTVTSTLNYTDVRSLSMHTPAFNFAGIPSPMKNAQEVKSP